MVHPNILHLRSHTQSSRSPSRSSPLSSSPSLPFSFEIRWTLFFTPYSLRQHWNGFALGATSSLGGAELPSTCLKAVALRAFRSSRSPHRRNSFSRRVSSAVGDFRRLKITLAFLVLLIGISSKETHSSASSFSKPSASWPTT